MKGRAALVIGLCALFSVGLTGCMNVGNTSASDANAIAQIQKGKSTKSDVRRIMGEPNNPYMQDGKSAWHYQHITTSALAAVPFASMVTNTMEEKNVTFYFDKNDVVEGIESGGTKM